MNKLLDEVLKKIKPSKEEISKVNIILDNIKYCLTRKYKHF